MEEKVNILVIASNSEEAEELKSIIPFSLSGKQLKIEKKFSFSLDDALNLLKNFKFQLVIITEKVNTGASLQFLKQIKQRLNYFPEIIFVFEKRDDLIENLSKIERCTCLKRNELNRFQIRKIIDNFKNHPESRGQNSSKNLYLREIDSLVKAIPEGVMIIDRFKNIVVMNISAERYLKVLNEGHNADSVKKIEEIDQMLNFIMAGEECVIKEIEVPEEGFFLRLEGSPVKVREQEIVGAVVLIRDVTNDKKVERMKNDFISVVSHELRTPLTTMKEFVSILLDEIPGKINSEQKEYLEIVKSNMDRLARIINEILDIAKIESGKIQIVRELLDVREIAREVVRTFMPLASEKGLYLKLKLSQSPLTTYGDRDRLAQIFSNLIHNAIKFTHNGGVEVRVYEKDNKIISEIEDTGIGIAKENMPKLFMKFQQFEETTRLKIPGTGLGLSITKHLVELHKGKIEVKSEYGKGSIFIFSLPEYTHHEALLELCAENLHNCIMLNKSFSLLFVEIINVDNVEKTLGKEKLNILKKEIENVFRNVLRRHEDLVFKNYDCFAILLNMTPKENALVVKGRIEQALVEYFHRSAFEIKNVKLRIGIAGYPEDGSREEELLDKAKANAEELL